MKLPPWEVVAFDPDKDAANGAKHGLSLARANDIDPATIIVEPDRRQDYGEARFIVTGVLDQRLHVMIVSPRDEAVRIISLRRANRREVRRYEQAR